MAHVSLILAALALTSGARPAPAQGWLETPIPVAASAAFQTNPAMVSDGTGGVFVAWEDGRTGPRLTFAQRLTSTGTVAPGWPVDGLGVLQGQPGQTLPVVLPDERGGVYIAAGADSWFAPGRGTLQHLDGRGGPRDGWPAGGLTFSPAGLTYVSAAVTSDLSGHSTDPHARTNGGPGPADVQGAGRVNHFPSLAHGSQGDLLIAWSYMGFRKDPNTHVGRIQPETQAFVDGTPVVPCPGYHGQHQQLVCSDGSGGAFVAWVELNNRYLLDDVIVAHHMRRDGTLDPAWPTYGMRVRPVPGQRAPAISPDGAGGFILVWLDSQDAVHEDVFAQRFTSGGDIAAGWPAEGLRLSSGPAEPGIRRDALDFEFRFTSLVPDGEGGVFVAWTEQRDDTGIATSRVLAQHVRGDGTIHPAWPSGGLELSRAPGTQSLPALTTDNRGGFLAAWLHREAGEDTLVDVRVQRRTSDGALFPGWTETGAAVGASAVDTQGPVIVADGAGGAIVCWVDDRTGVRNLMARRVEGADGFLADRRERPQLRPLPLLVHSPNTDGRVHIQFQLRDERPVSFRVVDAAGRVVAVRDLGLRGAGVHELVVNPGGRLRAGVYFVQLRLATDIYRQKVVVLQ